MALQQQVLSSESPQGASRSSERISRNLDLAVNALVIPWAERLSAIDPLAQVFTAGSSGQSRNQSAASTLVPLSDLDLLVLAPSLRDPGAYLAALEQLKSCALEFQNRSDLRPVFFTHAAQKHAWVALAKAYHAQEIVPVHFLFYPTEDLLHAREGTLGERLLANATLVKPADLPNLPHGLRGEARRYECDMNRPLDREFIFRWDVECALADFVLSYPADSQANQNLRDFALADLGQVLKKSLVNWVGPRQPFESEALRSHLPPATHAEFKSLVSRLLQEDFSPSLDEVKGVCARLLDALAVDVRHKVSKVAYRLNASGVDHSKERGVFVDLLRAHPETTIRLAEQMRVLDGVELETLMPIYNTFGDWPFEVLNIDVMGWERFVARSAERRERAQTLSGELKVVDLLSQASMQEFSEVVLEGHRSVADSSSMQDTHTPDSFAIFEALDRMPPGERELGCKRLAAALSEEDCIAGLSSDTSIIRRRAAELSGYFVPGPSHVEKMIAAASTDDDLGVRAWAVWALARGAPHERRAVETMAKMVTAPQTPLVKVAFKALEEIGPQAEPAIPYLKQLLGRLPAPPEVWRIEAALAVIKSMGPLSVTLIPDLVRSARLVLLNAGSESRIAFGKKLEGAISEMGDVELFECLASYPSQHARADYEHCRARGNQRELYANFGAVIASALRGKSTEELMRFMSKFGSGEEVCHVQWIIWERDPSLGFCVENVEGDDNLVQD